MIGTYGRYARREEFVKPIQMMIDLQNREDNNQG